MPNPALRDLDVLVGERRVELTNAECLDDAAVMTGTLTVDRLDDTLLVLRSVMDGDGPPTSVSVIGRNEAREDYEVFYADERGVSRIYRMTFADGRWTQHRADPRFHQRFEATVEAGHDRIARTWTRSHDDGAT